MMYEYLTTACVAFQETGVGLRCEGESRKCYIYKPNTSRLREMSRVNKWGEVLKGQRCCCWWCYWSEDLRFFHIIIIIMYCEFSFEQKQQNL